MVPAAARRGRAAAVSLRAEIRYKDWNGLANDLEIPCDVGISREIGRDAVTSCHPAGPPGTEGDTAMSRLRLRLAALAVLIVTAAGFATPAHALTSEEELVERARLTMLSMLSDRDFTAMHQFVAGARAVLIIPELYRGGFIFGGEGGSGVLLVRRPDGSWSYPSFYLMAAGSFGLQIGGQISEVVLCVMSERGLRALLNRYVTLGADASVAMVAVGAGIDARTGLDLDADMYAFSRNQGLFAGGVLEGSVVTEQDSRNQAYYGPNATADAIMSGQFVNSQADGLRAALLP